MIINLARRIDIILEKGIFIRNLFKIKFNDLLRISNSFQDGMISVYMRLCNCV